MPVVWPVQQRQGAYTSPSATIAQAGIWKISFVGIPQSDYEDPTKSIDIDLQAFVDGAWADRLHFTWRGVVGGYIGRNGEVNPAPAITFDSTSEWVGLQARVIGDIPVAMTFGIDVSRLS